MLAKFSQPERVFPELALFLKIGRLYLMEGLTSPL